MLSPKWQSGHRVCVLSDTAALSKVVALSCATQLPGQSPPAPPPKRPMTHGSNQRSWLSVGSTQDQRADPSVRVTGYRAPHQVPRGAFGTHGDSLSVTTGVTSMNRLERHHCCRWRGGELPEASGLHSYVSEVTATSFPTACLTLNSEAHGCSRSTIHV